MAVLRKAKSSTLAPGVSSLKAGFFRYAAYTLNDAESWHNYAACRQLVYGDFEGASEYYVKAIELNPKDANIQVNFKNEFVEKVGCVLMRSASSLLSNHDAVT